MTDVEPESATHEGPAGLSVALRATRGALGLDLAFEARESLAIVGPNGAGKTTLLRAIVGAIPAVGSLVLDGRSLLDSPRRVALPIEERDIAYVAQRPLLFAASSVRENLAYARTNGRRIGRCDRISTEALVEAFELAPLLDRVPGALSSGEAQRVALARALASAPRVLLLDEPFASIDVDVAARLRPRLAALLDTHGILAIVVTHVAADARALAQEALLLERGRVNARFRVDAEASALPPFAGALFGFS